jgi:hypothetical protein
MCGEEEDEDGDECATLHSIPWCLVRLGRRTDMHRICVYSSGTVPRSTVGGRYSIACANGVIDASIRQM